MPYLAEPLLHHPFCLRRQSIMHFARGSRPCSFSAFRLHVAATHRTQITLTETKFCCCLTAARTLALCRSKLLDDGGDGGDTVSANRGKSPRPRLLAGSIPALAVAVLQRNNSKYFGPSTLTKSLPWT
jgi:hypothetical protein